MIVLNIVRVILALACLWSMYIMTRSFYRHRDEWNSKTRNYWYGRMMWMIVGLSACIEGLMRNSPFRYTFVFTTAAILATLIANLQKGEWGTNDDHE